MKALQNPDFEGLSFYNFKREKYPQKYLRIRSFIMKFYKLLWLKKVIFTYTIFPNTK